MQTLETGYRSTLALKLESTDTTIVVATAPTVTAGRMHIYKGNTHAWIKYTGLSGTTLTGVTFVSQTADPTTTVTGTTFPAGTSIELVEMHDQMLDKQQGGTIAGAMTFSDDITVTGDTVTGATFKVPIYATTAARDSAIPAPVNGMEVYITADGSFYDYQGGIWGVRATGTVTPNASTTVAGKVEIATSAESIAGTDTGGTGANLSVIPSDIAKNTQSGTFVYGADSGGDDTYVVALTPTLAAYTTGQTLTMKVTTANTGACTVDFGPGAKSIKMTDGTNPPNGAITGIVNLMYDGTNFVLQTGNQIIKTGTPSTLSAGASGSGSSDTSASTGLLGNSTIGTFSYSSTINGASIFQRSTDGISFSDIYTYTNQAAVGYLAIFLSDGYYYRVKATSANLGDHAGATLRYTV